jgi:CRISPR-associated protein Cas2
MRWLVCYNVRDAKRLRICAKHMEGYGNRIQYSVFRCWLTSSEVERLRWELTEKLESADEVLLIPPCERCVEGIVGIHAKKAQEWEAWPPRSTIV